MSAIGSAVGSIDVAGLVSQLMGVERQPETLLTNRMNLQQKRADALDGVKTLLDDITKKANAFDTAAEWDLLKATSSNAAVTTSVGKAGFSGSLTFTVGALATSHKLYSTATVAATTTPVTTAKHLLLAAGGGAVGISRVQGGAGLALGSQTITTQVRAAAVKTGTLPSSTVTIDATNNEMVVELNGTPYTITLASGTGLGRQAVVDGINTAIAATPGATGQLAASLTPTGTLELKTTALGSANTIRVTGGSALGLLGVTTDTIAITGTDNTVKVGTNATLTLPDVVPEGYAASVDAGGGTTIGVTFSGTLRAGTLRTRNVDLGDGSMGAVVTAINNSGGDIGASAIKVGESAYRFQIQSKLSGVAGQMNIDPAVFDTVGGFSTLSAGTDASITVPGTVPLVLTSSTNTFADVLPGVSFTVNSKPIDDAAVTVTASRDLDSLTGKVQALIDATNKAISDVKTKTSYSAASKSGGPLTGDATMRRLQQELRSSLTDALGAGDITQVGKVGITLAKDGTLAFDKAKFLDAYNADPAAVQRLFLAETTLDPNPGITQRVAAVVKTAADTTSGYVSTAAKTRKNAVADITKQIDRFEDRMFTRQKSLTTQFTNLNTALGNLSTQSQWLSSQIASLH
jgi:flagellar hook-associated protein 2